uniref:Uncharacterized protein n=1 Tax=Arundo donax TaxID=35708 RepID=A0A0A8XRE1_ARUDO
MYMLRMIHGHKLDSTNLYRRTDYPGTAMAFTEKMMPNFD